MKDIVLERIENEVLPKMNIWVDTNKKVTRLTHRDFRNFFDTTVKKELRIRNELMSPATEEDFKCITKILLYVVQNKETRTTNDIITVKDFNKMLDGVIKNA